jgi:hypothetical protein
MSWRLSMVFRGPWGTDVGYTCRRDHGGGDDPGRAGPVDLREPDPGATELPFEHHDLVP